LKQGLGVAAANLLSGGKNGIDTTPTVEEAADDSQMMSTNKLNKDG